MAELRARRGFLVRLVRPPRTSAASERGPRDRAVDAAVREVQSPNELAADIARNLGSVLNTRKGCGSVLPGFGLGDYEVERNALRAIDCLHAELLAAVCAHEPRLREPSVRLLGRRRHDVVRFAIAGRVEGRRCALDVDLNTTTRGVEVRVAELEVRLAEAAP